MKHPEKSLVEPSRSSRLRQKICVYIYIYIEIYQNLVESYVISRLYTPLKFNEYTPLSATSFTSLLNTSRKMNFTSEVENSWRLSNLECDFAKGSAGHHFFLNEHDFWNPGKKTPLVKNTLFLCGNVLEMFTFGRRFIFQKRRLGFIVCCWLSVMSLFPKIVTVDVRWLEACRIFLYVHVWNIYNANLHP